MRYDKDHHSPEEIYKFTTKVTGSKAVKEDLKELSGLHIEKVIVLVASKEERKKQMMAAKATQLSHPGTILIPGIKHERNISSHAASVQSLGRCDTNFENESISDDRSNYKIDGTAVLEKKQLTEYAKRVMMKKS
eukprot:4814947-Ditylum_brightwellii.AAC.1